MISPAVISPAVATLRLAAFILWTLVALVPYLPLFFARWRGCARYVRRYFQGVAWICGIRVAAEGRPQGGEAPVLFVSNHASYLDIIVLGTLINGSFVAKTEVAGWPGFGFLAKMARTVFVARRRGGTARERDALQERLDAGDSLILFPEGTSNDGNRVLPFKSALFAVAERDRLVVQPVSLAYTRLDGLPMGRAFRPFYAWYGDMTLPDHLFQALGLGRITVEVVFHRPVRLSDFRDRKALANHCHDVVTRGVVTLLAGRWRDHAAEAQALEQAPLPLDPVAEG
ncbi:MAG: lysophospholipid acyltransferase family protein [Solirubrobacterales bacterium]